MNRLLSIRRVVDQTDCSPSYIYALVDEGKFPAPISPKLGRQNRWSENKVQQWVADRAAGLPLVEGMYRDPAHLEAVGL